ncbi:hypothetical protein AK88_00575 [Plasmodium fragile]|uniref:Uncharacterized protein n=1 Tax=Plasmodium fragile TaxID=5857 RepID=A0A0D9QS14_PLAFR|nr:uncharacterized protein AK88_00575 [Plasmodium fragile]KJP89864.1 hypothetical protein AK88_00575 [Plasmodium fragile]
MNPKPFYKAPKVTKEELEKEFDKTWCHRKSSWDELTDASQYTEEELLHRRTKQDMCKSNFFAECSKKKEQTCILFKCTSKKVHTYIHAAVGDFICLENGSIPMHGKMKTFKKRKKNPHKVFFFSEGTSYINKPPDTYDGSSDSVDRGTPFEHHNRRNYNTRGTKLDTAKWRRTRGKNLNEKETMSPPIFDGKCKNDDQHNIEHTTCVKVAGEEKRNANNGRSFCINKNETSVPRRCMDDVIYPYSFSKANEQENILTNKMNKLASGKLRLRISEKNKLDKTLQVAVEGKLNAGSTHPLSNLRKRIMPRGRTEKKINYGGYIVKQEESKQVAVGYDIMSSDKRQKGSPHVRLCVYKESTRKSDPTCPIDFVQMCPSVDDKRMQNYLNEQLKYYGSNMRRENLEQICLYLRKRPQRRAPHGLASSHRIGKEHPNVPPRPCQTCKKDINLKRYIMDGDDKENTSTMITDERDVDPAISDQIMNQMRGREKEKNEGETTNLAHKNKLTHELKLKKFQNEEEINFSTIYTHLTNEKKILKKILNQQTRKNKKDYLKKLIQVKKYITNFVTYFEQILAKIQVEKNEPYDPTYDEDKHYHISALLKLVEDVISILSDHFYHVK